MNNIVNYRLIHESINESVNQLINESINESMNQLINESINESINGSMNQLINDNIDINDIHLQEDKNVNIKNVFDIINLLPYDIKRKIYEDYIRIPYLKSQFYIELKSNDSQRLISRGIYDRYIKMKNIPNLMNYIIKDDDIINKLYTQHFILKKKCFVRLNIHESFILAILFTLYH
jgi:hypothetical protein